ncbi:Protein RKD3 [Acorus gramineus]|uniref:Protein RKD3 n=1 Tax=Acorus gramineus TaxID=55184 RepID=A0AAV9AIL5_ACOGR|nr:Protein RKD3 [Acorus gramineus]KAK1263661.1 Protein RKD3 [Acorus gramineus]
MRLKDLVGYFHLPITSAAKELQVCSTALKKVCRRNGVKRWPHRKVTRLSLSFVNLVFSHHISNTLYEIANCDIFCIICIQFILIQFFSR